MTAPEAGWYPDPAGSGGTRWWDGRTWTEHVQQPTPATAPTGAPTGASPWGNTVAAGSGQPAGAGWGVGYQPAAQPFLRRNRLSLTAIGFAVLYAVLLVTVHVVVLGILPAVLVVRAWKAREQLAAPATVLAVLTLVVAIYQLNA